MINIFSIRCGLAFAPYLVESVAQFLDGGAVASRVVRQGGSGLIIRSDGDVMLRFQNREVALALADVRHYRATIQFRMSSYEIERMQDEVVMSNFGSNLVLSHPQSELWLERKHLREMLRAYKEGSVNEDVQARLPDWLSISTGAGRLLVSDGRNGRWVLLGSDHIAELGRRVDLLDETREPAPKDLPPTIALKGMTIHLQSAFKLAETLEAFAQSGEVAPFDEATPMFSLSARRSIEGIELRDSDKRVALTRKESGKWAEIIRSELERFNANSVERGRIRTVFANGERGRWVLQWGDGVFVPEELLSQNGFQANALLNEKGAALKIGRVDEFTVMLAASTGACVALNESESGQVFQQRSA